MADGWWQVVENQLSDIESTDLTFAQYAMVHVLQRQLSDSTALTFANTLKIHHYTPIPIIVTTNVVC